MKKKKAPTLASLKTKAWKLLSLYVRQKDADEDGFVSCYTCGRSLHWKYESQAGHAIPGRRGAVLLDAEILRNQCYACNAKHIGNGQHHIFATKLIKENGMPWWEAKLEGARQVVKLTRSDLEEKIAMFKEKLSAL